MRVRSVRTSLGRYIGLSHLHLSARRLLPPYSTATSKTHDVSILRQYGGCTSIGQPMNPRCDHQLRHPAAPSRSPGVASTFRPDSTAGQLFRANLAPTSTMSRTRGAMTCPTSPATCIIALSDEPEAFRLPETFVEPDEPGIRKKRDRCEGTVDDGFQASTSSPGRAAKLSAPAAPRRIVRFAQRGEGPCDYNLTTVLAHR